MQTINDLIETTATLLQREDILEELQSIENDETTSQSKDLRLLIDISNLVIREVCEEYSPIVSIEKIESNSVCQILLANLSKQFLKTIWVKNENGEKETFNTYSTFIKVAKPYKVFEICYQYQPEKFELDDEIEISPEISIRLLAYGVASEFCLTELLFDESIMWDTRFKSSIQNAVRKTSGRKLKERRFFS